MLNQKTLALGKNRSEIRELFEYGNYLKANGLPVCDLTLGNPSTKTPDWVTKTLINGACEQSVHAYTSAQGSFKARTVIANSLNSFGKSTYSPDGIILTCGAAASLTGVFTAITENYTDEIIVLAPYFPEYKVFIESAGANFTVVGFKGDNFTPNFEELESKITKNTKAVVINNPNNPSGKVFSDVEIKTLTSILTKKQEEFNTCIFLISDEPYREIVFDGEKLPFIPDYYLNTIICYSFSKSLSLPGERIGYIAISNENPLLNDLYAGFLGALRSMGYVCAPSLFQYMIENFKGEFSDFSVYEQNKNLLISNLKNLGYTCNNPKGAFYLMIKAPNGNSKEFSEKAKKLGLLIVPADSFGASGWLRIATCVSPKTAKDSLPLFEKLI